MNDQALAGAQDLLRGVIARLPDAEAELVVETSANAWRQLHAAGHPFFGAFKSEARRLCGPLAAKAIDACITDNHDPDLGWPEALDLEALAEREPQPPSFIVPDWLPAGEVTLFAGHGGSGKSQVALDLAVCIAAGGVLWCGMTPVRKCVRYISAEDSSAILDWRLKRICAYRGVDMASLRGWIHIIDASHIDAELMGEIPHEEPILTRMYSELQSLVDPGGVLILDGASDLYGASEIMRRHVRRYVRALRRLINVDGAVLLLSHVDKAAARGRENGDYYSGSTAWNNSVRARWSLRGDGDVLVLSLDKANHAKAGAEIRLRWDASAHLYVVDSAPVEGGIVATIRERQEREGIIAAMRGCAKAGIIVPAALQGPRTAHNVLANRPELPDSLRSGKDAGRKFRARLEDLRQIRAVIEREVRRSNRHTTLALELSDIGSAPNAPDSTN